jgi:uncharacterized membrane protein
MFFKLFYFGCFGFGFFLEFFQEFFNQKKSFILIIGFCLLMFALYNISKGIGDRPNNETFIENEEEE